jgi:hypothetical protein
MRNVHIRQYEYGLLFRDGGYRALLEPGNFRIWRPWRTRIEVVNRLETRFSHPSLDAMLRDEIVRTRLKVVDLKENQRALVWKGDHLGYVVGPGRHAFWRFPYPLTVEVRDVREAHLRHPRLEAIIRHADACTLFGVVNVGRNEQLLLFRDGRLIETLGEGAHAFWQGAGNIQWKIIRKNEDRAVAHSRAGGGHVVAKTPTSAGRPSVSGRCRVDEGGSPAIRNKVESS